MSLDRYLNKSCLILLVDDTPDNLRLLSKILEAQGFKVRKTVSGKMAIQAAQMEPPDLILLDINMPEINGYEVCKQLKLQENTANIPIIFISALDQTADKIRAFETGGVDYITKPFQELEVLARVRNQLIIYQQQQQLTIQNKQLQQEISERQAALRDRKQVEAALQALNRCFEKQLVERTTQLQQALEFEERLKRITDKVRDSLDEKQIWQVAVEELTVGLELDYCYSSICDIESKTFAIAYEYKNQNNSYLARDWINSLILLPELCQTLLPEQTTQFCWCESKWLQKNNCKYAILFCPILDEQGILGNLWLFKPRAKAFDELEVRLVKQVANHCAIALHQARLYQAAQVQVQELQKLNQLKDDFLGCISHELRTPIANIKSLIQLLETELTISNAQSKTMSECFVTLHEECESELKLIQDLLDLQYLGAESYPLQLTTLDLHDWIPHTLEAFLNKCQQQQKNLQIHLASDLPLLTTDMSSLGRILHELVNNACKYTPVGETINVTACQKDGMLHISVSNSGVEIPEVELSRIFDKFYRIPNTGRFISKGTGLGLALVKKLVEHLSGSISAESQAGQICFTVVLPIIS